MDAEEGGNKVKWQRGTAGCPTPVIFPAASKLPLRPGKEGPAELCAFQSQTRRSPAGSRCTAGMR